jgi:hypothetical protein
LYRFQYFYTGYRQFRLMCVSTGNHPSAKPDFLERFQIDLPLAISTLASEMEVSVLPADYKPQEFDVFCGRGKGKYNSSGNIAFRNIVRLHVFQYLGAKTKLDKTMVLNSIINKVREQAGGQTHFVKKLRDGRWVDIGDELAREKCGHALREAINACLSPIEI